jgi:PAS domain S-box-containing protein
MDVIMSDEQIIPFPAPQNPQAARRYAELLSDAEFTRGVLTNSTESIKVLDLDARIELLSVGALRMLDIDNPEALVGVSWLSLWNDETLVAAATAIADAKSGKTGRFEGARPTTRGAARWCEVTVSPILGPDGRPARLLVIARDLTEHRRAQQLQQALAQELHHRVKNILAMVMAITSQSLAHAESMTAGRLAVEQRLMALAEAHNVMREGGAAGASLRQIIEGAIAPYEGPSRFTVTGDDVLLAPPAPIALTMALHELATNAARHGALSAESGRIEIAWSVDAPDGRFHFGWRERGGPPAKPPARRGFGMRVIEANLRDQLRGEVKMSFEPAGLVCTIDAPLLALQGGPHGA